jgi:hypothetical protein
MRRSTSLPLPRFPPFPSLSDSLDLLHQQVHHGAQAAPVPQVGPHGQRLPRGVVHDEGVGVDLWRGLCSNYHIIGVYNLATSGGLPYGLVP